MDSTTLLAIIGDLEITRRELLMRVSELETEVAMLKAEKESPEED